MRLIQQTSGIFTDRPDVDGSFAAPMDRIQKVSDLRAEEFLEDKFPVIAALNFYSSGILNSKLRDCFKK